MHDNCVEWFFVLLNSIVDHTRVKLADSDASVTGAEYINANYIRQYKTDACDLNSLALDTVCAVCTFAQQQKNCQNCQILNKICVQCTMKSATIVPDRNCSNCGPDSEVSIKQYNLLYQRMVILTLYSRFRIFSIRPSGTVPTAPYFNINY